jgi:hypothetical protein
MVCTGEWVQHTADFREAAVQLGVQQGLRRRAAGGDGLAIEVHHHDVVLDQAALVLAGR